MLGLDIHGDDDSLSGRSLENDTAESPIGPLSDADMDGIVIGPSTEPDSDENPFAQLADPSPMARYHAKAKVNKYVVDGQEVEETVFSFPVPGDSSLPAEREKYAGRHGDAHAQAKRMSEYLSRKVEGHQNQDVDTPLAEANEFLDGMVAAQAPMDQRAEAYWLFLRAFLPHPLGGRPSFKLIKRQASEGVPFTTRGAITAFKAAREHRPLLRDLLPIMPPEMTPELIYIFAVALVDEQHIPPHAMRSMIGGSLAAVRRDGCEAGEATPPSTDQPDSTSSSPNALTPYPSSHLSKVAAEAADEVPAHKWELDLHFPLILSHFPTADFRGALVALNDLRAAARWQREQAIAAGRKWPGAASRPLVNCYTAVMSLWVRAIFAGYKGHGRRGRRIGSGVPYRLAVDLGNLMVPNTRATSAREAATAHPGDIASDRAVLSTLAAADPMLSLVTGLLSASATKTYDDRYHHRNPFLAAWLNAERIAHNYHIAAGVWEQISGQSVAASIAGYKAPLPPSPEAYEILLRMLKSLQPTSFRPLVSTIFNGGKGDVPSDLFDILMSCLSMVPHRAPTDWSELVAPWASLPPTTEPDPSRPVPPPPRPVPGPDLPLMFVLLEEYQHMLRPRTLNSVGEAVIRAARHGAIPTRTKGRTNHLALSTSSLDRTTAAEWGWLNSVLSEKETAEARRGGREAEELPQFPITLEDLWKEDAQRFKQQLGRGDGTSIAPLDDASSTSALVERLMPALKRTLFDTILTAARQRGVEGSAAEVFAAELKTLRADMNVGEDTQRLAETDVASYVTAGMNDAVDAASEAKTAPVGVGADQSESTRGRGRRPRHQEYSLEPDGADIAQEEQRRPITVTVEMKEGVRRKPRRKTGSGKRKQAQSALLAMMEGKGWGR